MPVYKHRSIEAMADQTWRRAGDPELFRAMAFTFELARRTNRRHFTPGVYRYRNVEEMNRADEERLRDHVRARRLLARASTPTP